MIRLPLASLLASATLLCASLGALAGNGTFSESLQSQKGLFELRFRSDLAPLRINRMHGWTLELRDDSGEPVSDARIRVAGGMPGHNHGLPTAPLAEATARPGRYRIEGLRFHMPGDWEVEIEVDTGQHEDRFLIPLQL